MLHIYNAKSAKKAARAFEKFAEKLGMSFKHGQALDALAIMTGFQSWAGLETSVSEEALNARLGEVERRHIADNADNRYGQEAAVVAHNGFELRYDCDQELLTYVRICDPLGREIAYWVSEEWEADPQLVMGAILGALTQGRAVTLINGKRASAPEAKEKDPVIQDVPFDNVSNVLINGAPYPVRYRDGDVLAKLLEETMDSDEEGDCYHVALQLCDDEDGLLFEKVITLATLRGMKWSATKQAFIGENGHVYEFYVQRKFGTA
ncbi:hypothetical protein F6X40_11415 [Paraburkholderia sp. UCT31]|uniref:hypothetical protein n=1 Tax=Paraburkholderia sp. UCT31 TaxID=2615209 RepID=UPI0016558B65|nr:hypothetical protein [Paraburkholderia sp. UCT31]MBC8737413.1 hypothetical protein [Paraburkholderia sp. UCT31]